MPETYDELEKKYNQLEKKYNQLNHRFHSVIKMNDRFSKVFFNKSLKSNKLEKRVNTIIKQSDKQSKYWLSKSQEQEELLTEQSKLVAMGEMIENIIHQMKQPLSLISTASTAMELKKEMDILSDKEFNNFTSKILESTQYLNETIENFRDFFCPNKTKESISILDAIVHSKKLLESKFKGREIKLIYNIDDISIYGVKNSLIQILTNLLSNSIDAFENIKDTDKIIFITSMKNDDHIVIKVKDTAGGIDKDIIKNIFQSHFTTKSKDKGTGVGLYMTKMIVENNFSGTITVSNQTSIYNNKKYNGAEFLVKLVNNKKI